MNEWRHRLKDRLLLPRRAADMPEVRPRIAPWAARFVWGQDEVPEVGTNDVPDGLIAVPDLADFASFIDDSAPCFWVTGPMAELLTAAAKSYPLDAEPPPPPTERGFVAFAEALRPWPAGQALRAFVWVEQVAVPLISYEGLDEPIGPWAEGMTQPFPMVHGAGLDRPSWKVGSRDRVKWHSSVADAWRLMVTCTTMMQQRIAVTSPVDLDRAGRRRLARAGLPPAPDIRLIDLRRPTEQERHPGPRSPVEWSHRWIVDGHWRNQWYPAEKKHMPVWIAPHVKGPDDKPLVVHEKVYRWSR